MLRSTEVVARAGMFLFGIVIALLGGVLPLISARLRLDLGVTANLFLAMNAAMLLGSLAFGPIIDRFGFRGVLSGGPVMIAVALALVTRAEGPAGLLRAVALLGLGGSAVNSATNTLVADLHPDPVGKGAALNRLGVYYGFGALLLPFLIGWLVERTGLAPILLTAAASCIVVATLAVSADYPPAKQASALSVREAVAVVRQPLVMVLGVLLFFESGNEFLLAGYCSVYLTRQTAASLRAASFALAGYWAALMLGRTLLGHVLPRLPGMRFVPVMAGLAAAAAVLAAVAPSFPLAAAALIAAGLSLAGIFPTALGVAGARFPERSGTIFGVLFTIGLSGGVTSPWIAGHLAVAWGLQVVMLLAAAGFFAVMLLALRAARFEAAADPLERGHLCRRSGPCPQNEYHNCL